MEEKDKWIPYDGDFKEEGALEYLKELRNERYESYSDWAKRECDTLIRAYEGDFGAQKEDRKFHGGYESQIAMVDWIYDNMNPHYCKKECVNS